MPTVATIDEIARRANVSKTTVSFVINGRPGPSAATTERVLRTMEEMNYVPSRLAQRFASKRSQTIALVFLPYPNIFSDSHHGQVLDAVYETLNTQSYSLLLETSNELFFKEQRHLRMIQSGMVDGVLLLEPTLEQDFITEMAGLDAPIAIINGDGSRYGVDSVRNDDRDVGRRVARHLLDLGHRQICFVAGSANHASTRDRRLGFTEELAKAGIDLLPDQVFEGDYGRSQWSGHEGCMRLMQRYQATTALFCGNDTMAVGALQAASELGLQVPHDLSIVGVDDNIISSYSNPPLTTVRQHSHEIAKQTVELLLERLGRKHEKRNTDEAEPDAPPEQRLLKPSLIIRRSTAAPSR